MYRSLRMLVAVSSAALLAPLTLSAQDSAKKLDDATIAAIFDAANTYDIETSGLGAVKASDPAVRQMAANFVRDHKQVRQMGRDLLAKLHVTPTRPAGDKSAAATAAEMKKLRGLSGKAFDKAYLDYEIAFHQSVIDAVTTTLLPAIQNPELKALVEKVAPAFQGHLAGAKHLREKMGA